MVLIMCPDVVRSVDKTGERHRYMFGRLPGSRCVGGAINLRCGKSVEHWNFAGIKKRASLVCEICLRQTRISGGISYTIKRDCFATVPLIMSVLCYASWYSFSVLTFHTLSLFSIPFIMFFTASKDVTIEWSMLL